MKIVAQIAAALAFAQSATGQFVPPGCNDISCTIYQVSICGDPHVKTLDGMYDVTGSCDDVMLMDNDSYDSFGNDYMMTATIEERNSVFVVGSMMLEIGGEMISVASSGSMMVGSGASGMSALSADGCFEVAGNEVCTEKVFAADARALQQTSGGLIFGPNGFYLNVSVFTADGVIFVISTKYGVVCITVIGTYAQLDAIDGLLGHTMGEGDIGDFIPAGCSIASQRLRARRSLSAIEGSNEACSHLEGADKNLCAFDMLMKDGKIPLSI